MENNELVSMIMGIRLEESKNKAALSELNSYLRLRLWNWISSVTF